MASGDNSGLRAENVDGSVQAAEGVSGTNMFKVAQIEIDQTRAKPRLYQCVVKSRQGPPAVAVLFDPALLEISGARSGGRSGGRVGPSCRYVRFGQRAGAIHVGGVAASPMARS